MNTINALLCSVYKDSVCGDCSNNGISARYKEVYVACPDGNEKIDLDNPPENFVVPEIRHFGFGDYIRLNPANNKGRWNMFGGAFVWSCDSRMNK